MSIQLLSILKFFLIALVWLFFLRVVRAVMADLKRSPALATSSNGSQPKAARKEGERSSGLRLKVLAPPQREGATFDLGEEITIGRAPGCGIPLDDDSYISNLHARVFTRDGTVWVEDLGSTNGTFVNERRISKATPLHRGDRLQVGRTILETSK